MKTKKPSAIVYGWHTLGEQILTSEVYWEEGLQDEVYVFSLPFAKFIEDIVVGYAFLRTTPYTGT